MPIVKRLSRQFNGLKFILRNEPGRGWFRLVAWNESSKESDQLFDRFCFRFGTTFQESNNVSPGWIVWYTDSPG
jgi:hypothetical protein